MHAKTTIFLGLLLAISAMPMANAGHGPNLTCTNNAETVHTYDASLGAFVTYVGPVSGNTNTAGVAATGVVDGCEIATGGYDGETEAGVAGGRFAAGTSTCLVFPEVAHHAYGNGAKYWANDWTGLVSLTYSAGADGPALVQVTGCETDGIISNDPTTDPADCGAGLIGVYIASSTPPPTWTPATLQPTSASVPGSCDPHDGFVWVFLANGVDTITGIVSTPVLGDIWHE